MNRKVIIVTPWYGEFAGGAELAARKLVENLVSIGLDVGVFTTCCKSPFDNWWTDYYRPGSYEKNGIQVLRFSVNYELSEFYFKINEKLMNGLPVYRDEQLKYMRGVINSHDMISYIKTKKQYTYVFIPYLYGTTFWGINALRHEAVIIPCLHDEAIAKWDIIKEMLLKAKKIIFLSEPEKELAKKICDTNFNKMPVLGIGIDTDIYSDGSRFRKKYGINEPFLIYVGRKDKGKNVLQLVEYFKNYIALYDKTMKMVFIGDGDVDLIPSNDSRFIDLHYIPEQDKFDAIAASVALCNLSDMESFSFVIMESWLTGTPVVVSSRNNVTRNHCMKSGGGVIVTDDNEFCQAIKQLSENAVLSKKMGKYGKEYVLREFSWESILPKYVGVFGEIT